MLAGPVLGWWIGGPPTGGSGGWGPLDWSQSGTIRFPDPCLVLPIAVPAWMVRAKDRVSGLQGVSPGPSGTLGGTSRTGREVLGDSRGFFYYTMS